MLISRFFMKMMPFVFLISVFTVDVGAEEDILAPDDRTVVEESPEDHLQLELVWKGEGDLAANLDLYLLHRVEFEGREITYFELLEGSENKSGFEKIVWKAGKRPDRYFVAVNYRNGFQAAEYDLLVSSEDSQTTRFADSFSSADRYSVRFYGPIDVNDRGIDLSFMTRLEGTATY